MTNPNAKDLAVQVLSISGKITFPLSEDHKVSLESWLSAIDCCTWEFAKDKIQKRQFETSLKCYFKEFDTELVKFHRENPPTFEGKPKGHITVGLHTMDDQGFEGQCMSDGTFYRWIKDFEDDP